MNTWYHTICCSCRSFFVFLCLSRSVYIYSSSLNNRAVFDNFRSFERAVYVSPLLGLELLGALTPNSRWTKFWRFFGCRCLLLQYGCGLLSTARSNVLRIDNMWLPWSENLRINRNSDRTEPNRIKFSTPYCCNIFLVATQQFQSSCLVSFSKSIESHQQRCIETVSFKTITQI